MMDCSQFRADLESFADGELDQRGHDDAINHFQSCPSCQARVSQIQQMKVSLERLWSNVHAPAALRNQITSALDHESSSASISFDQKEDHLLKRIESESTTVARSGFRRWLMPSTIAAAIIVAFMVLPGRHGDRSATSFTIVPTRAVEAVVDQHRICGAYGGALHHDKALSRDLDTIAQRLGEQLGLSIFVPDLSDRGYEMVGANRCGIGNQPGSHILYRSGAGSLLSVFTVHRLGELTVAQPGRNEDRHYFVSESQDTCVVAWHQNRESHVLCGKMARSEMIELIEGVRTASVDQINISYSLLAEIP